MINFDVSGILDFNFGKLIGPYSQSALTKMLDGHPMNGWVSLPDTGEDRLAAIEDAAAAIRLQSDVVVVIGAGGSSLGARALIEALGDYSSAPEVLWCGDNLSGSYLSRLKAKLGWREFSVIATSKSGSTLETTLALRWAYSELKSRYGGAAGERLTIITENKASPLREFALSAGAAIFDIPLNVGGRYSVLSPAGLLPAAVCGIDIRALISGAKLERDAGPDTAIEFATIRNAFYDAGNNIEIFSVFEPEAERFGGWWRQLFGESEGKAGGGIFPATVAFTGDLHSMGQYIQEGRRNLFETALVFDSLTGDAEVREACYDDGAVKLAGDSMNRINSLAVGAVLEAHRAGGVPVIKLTAPRFDETGFGAAIYFLELTCAFSCFIRNIDPFDQPGVEAYKKRVKAALGM